MPQHNEAPAPIAPPRKREEFPVLAAMRRRCEQEPKAFAGRLAEILEVASYAKRIDMSHYTFGYVSRGPIYNRDDYDAWVEGLLEVGRDDSGLPVRWPVGFLIRLGTQGVAADMTVVDLVICSPNLDSVCPLPSRVIVDWRPYADEWFGDEPFVASDSAANRMRYARGLKTTTDASRDDLLRMSARLMFAGNYAIHVAEACVPGATVVRRNDDDFAHFASAFYDDAKSLRLVLDAVVIARTGPAGTEPADHLDRHFVLGGRGILGALSALQYAHNKLVGARKA